VILLEIYLGIQSTYALCDVFKTHRRKLCRNTN